MSRRSIRSVSSILEASGNLNPITALLTKLQTACTGSMVGACVMDEQLPLLTPEERIEASKAWIRAYLIAKSYPVKEDRAQSETPE